MDLYAFRDFLRNRLDRHLELVADLRDPDDILNLVAAIHGYQIVLNEVEEILDEGKLLDATHTLSEEGFFDEITPADASSLPLSDRQGLLSTFLGAFPMPSNELQQYLQNKVHFYKQAVRNARDLSELLIAYQCAKAWIILRNKLR